MCAAEVDVDVVLELAVLETELCVEFSPPLVVEDAPIEVMPCDVGTDVAVSFSEDVGDVADVLAEEAVADAPVDAGTLSESVSVELLVAAELDDPAAASSVPTLK